MQPRRSDGANHRVEVRTGSCFRSVGRHQSGGPLACPLRALNASGPHGNAANIAARLAAATILQPGSASTDILLGPTSPSVLHTSSNSGFLLASESDSRFPIRSVHERIRRTSHLGHAADSGSLSGIPTPPWSCFVPAAPSTPDPGTA